MRFECINKMNKARVISKRGIQKHAFAKEKAPKSIETHSPHSFLLTPSSLTRVWIGSSTFRWFALTRGSPLLLFPAVP